MNIPVVERLYNKNYVSSDGIDTSLPVHTLIPNEPYLMGIFLVGAYQEILGDMHNLFGDTHSVSILMTAEGSYKLISPIKGDTVRKMLDYVGFDTNQLLGSYNDSLQNTTLSTEQKQLYLQELKAGLDGYTYFEM